MSQMKIRGEPDEAFLNLAKKNWLRKVVADKPSIGIGNNVKNYFVVKMQIFFQFGITRVSRRIQYDDVILFA